jgi:hypothetical protein
MTAIIADQMVAIEAACKRHGVARLHVFGSALRDVDLLVEFGPMEPYTRVDAYFELLDELRRILTVEVDLVVEGAVRNRYIAQDIERTKQMLYAA